MVKGKRVYRPVPGSKDDYRVQMNQLKEDWKEGNITKATYHRRLQYLKKKEKKAPNKKPGYGKNRSINEFFGSSGKKSSKRISLRGFRLGMAKLMNRGYSKQGAYNTMKNLASSKR
ncbi:hypothetical protein [Methanolobus sp. WCC4]|uniref:hypothetical protein n=1 Tax=Methanolobus sp. WCC4 TaxID=3125784 RepID=UPI0030F52375